MKLHDFKYTLPKDLFAEHPTKERENARLMVVDRKTGKIEHKLFKDLINYLDPKDVLVVNNTKVFPALLEGVKEKTDAKITVYMLRELNAETLLWDVIVDPARKIRIGNKLYFGNDSLVAEVIDNTTSRGRTVRFLFDGTHDEFISLVRSLGKTPLPEFLQQTRSGNNPKEDREDKEYYQTEYARNEGAVAAPAAGLHFSKMLLKRLELKDVRLAEITLHAGFSNFKPLEVEDLSKHRMDSEEMFIDEKACNTINAAKAGGHKVCVVGTTSMKAVETAVTVPGTVSPFSGWTNKFIYAPYNFSIADMMITNFHPPMTSMMIMASAFAGYDLLMEAYRVAIKEKYKFYTYGDAMLIL